MDELIEQFLIEGRDLIAQANAAFERLCHDPADLDAIDGAFRAVHTLKGSVGIFDMAPAERVLHAAEDRLARARSTRTALAADEVADLIAAIDQLDRWIDEIEHDGALGADAGAIADDLLAGGRSPGKTGAAADDGPVASPGWLDALATRSAALIDAGDAALTAFRYTPDSDAFFRGEDPIALVATVPDLLSLHILPAGGAWPAADAIEPFACIMVLEGLSSAAPDVLAQAFRLVPGQIAIASIDRRDQAQPDTNDDGARPTATAVLRVDAERVDRLADDVGELVISTNAFAAIADRADAIDRQLALEIRAAQAGLERAVGAISRSVSSVRMVSLAPALRRLPRLVREIAADLGRPVVFTMTGDHLEVDKQIADGLFEPLLHLVRNALDHGIEPEDARRQAGKAATGRLNITIARDGEDILVALADDGAGIDRSRVRDIAVARGLVAREAADALSDAGTLALLFTPGFSTAATVTGVSGRGVGMDAVQAAIDRLRGRIEIDSTPGIGTTMLLRLPANAITTRLLVIEVARDRYAVPIDQIVETVRVPADRLIPLGSGTACVLRDRTVPVLSLAELLGRTEAGAFPAKLLVTRASGDPVALRVDGFHERLDAMVRPSSGLLASVKLVGGTTVMGDGAVMLVLNMAELVA